MKPSSGGVTRRWLHRKAEKYVGVFIKRFKEPYSVFFNK
jgi:hypothetical protein